VATIGELVDVVVTNGGFPLLAGATLQIDDREVTVLTGDNGAGKTSVLRVLAGLSPVTSGRAIVLGVDLMTTDRRLLRRRVGWLGHEGSFYDDLTVKENLTFAAGMADRPTDAIASALDRVGLTSRQSTRTQQLSAGQRRRLGLAWLLIRRPALWLLDEPYASLDARGRDFLDDLLRDVVAAGAGVVVSSHDPLGHDRFATRTVEMAGGRILGHESA